MTKTILPTSAALLIAAGCATKPPPPIAESWAQPAKLGASFPTYRPPRGANEPARQPPVSEPDGPLALNTALALALAGSPHLEAVSWDVRAGEARMLQASRGPNPELSLAVEDFPGTGDFADGGGAEITLQAARVFELGGKRDARMKAAELGRDAATWGYEAKRLAVFSHTAADFLDVVHAQQRIALAEDSVKLAREFVEAVKVRVQAAAAHPAETTKAELALASAEIERDQMVRALAATRRNLAANWGGLSPKFQAAEGRLELAAAVPTWEQIAGGAARNPELSALAAEIARSAASVELAKTSAKADITLGGGLRHKSDPGDATVVFGVSMPLPMYDLNEGSIAEAEASVGRARASLRAKQLELASALAKAHGELVAAHARCTAIRDRVLPGAQRVLDQAGERYRAGRTGLLDVLEAQRTLIAARSQLLDGTADVQRAVLELERLTGEPLPVSKH